MIPTGEGSRASAVDNDVNPQGPARLLSHWSPVRGPACRVNVVFGHAETGEAHAMDSVEVDQRVAVGKHRGTTEDASLNNVGHTCDLPRYCGGTTTNTSRSRVTLGNCGSRLTRSLLRAGVLNDPGGLNLP